jgi:hypothetical protein
LLVSLPELHELNEAELLHSIKKKPAIINLAYKLDPLVKLTLLKCGYKMEI